MKRINKHNYEVFFLDYIDGKLNDSYKAEFESFLNENPRLKEELEDLENISLKPEKIRFKKKKDLIRDTQSKHFKISNFEYLCVGDLENDLNKDEELELQGILKSKSKYRIEHKLIKSTKLRADFSITYPYKKQLEKKQLPIFMKAGSVAAAAVIAIVILLNQTGLNTDSTINSNIRSIAAFNNDIDRPIQIIEEDNNSNVMQEALIFHNQTVKQTNNNDLAFNDNESHNKENLYKEITVSIPDLRSETLISETNNVELANYQTSTQTQSTARIRKEDLWKYAETGVNVWKLLTSDDLEMNNKYKKDGSIKKLNLVASNFKFSRTFNNK